jgi:GNAT superfamily N-acetyltransferase
MINGIHVDDLRSNVSASLIAEIYREILEPSFRPDELDTSVSFIDGMASGQPLGLCALDGETPVGCILGYPYQRSRVLLIGYVAVKPGLRGRGIGGLLLHEAQQRWYQKPEFTLVVAEIEDPRHHPAVADINPKRRVSFYARRGAQVVIGPYFQPRVGGVGKKRVYNFFLTVLSGSSGSINPNNSVDAGQLTGFLLEYFRASEGSDWPEAEDEEGNQLLEWYRRRETVQLHAIGEYARIDIPRIILTPRC